MIALVGAAVIGGTIAFYNDTETSSGNIFTAGSIDLTVDSQGSSYNGNDLFGSNFAATNLTNEQFFVFGDIKPGDYGIRNISLHAASNPAYACLFITNKEDDENVVVDPETEAGDTLSDGVPYGELSTELNVFAWNDLNGDQTFDPGTGEVPLVHDGLSPAVDSFFDITYEIFYDSSSGLAPLVQNDVEHIGLAWCAGTQTVNYGTGAIACDGSGMGDIAQTDKFSADITLYAEQVRNNPDFLCSDVEL